MFKARLFKTFPQKKVKCLACQRYCQINNNQVGFCQTRLNKDGQLYSLTYGILNGIQIDPIEKKPMYHFYPGTQVLSIGSYGCNYRCRQCLNWHCSWGDNASTMLAKLKIDFLSCHPGDPAIAGSIGSRRGFYRLPPKADSLQNDISPQELVDLTIKGNYPGIAFTYNEPSIWPEYVYDCAKLAKAKGFYTVFVTNGSWSQETLSYLAPVIDAANIDIKGFYPETYAKMAAFFGKLLAVTELAIKKYKIFTELTTLVIPTINDSTKELTAISQWIAKNLGPEIPWHLSRFDPDLSPDEQFKRLPTTPIATLKKAYEIGKKAGLKHIYVWAPPKNLEEQLFSLEDTFCPKCGKLVIKRNAWQPELRGVQKKGKKIICQFCQKKLNLQL